LRPVNILHGSDPDPDALIFEHDERDPAQDLRFQFEAVSALEAEEQAVVREVLESLIIKYQARRWDSARTGAAAQAAKAAKGKAKPARARAS
jgi:hypothetical protein